MNLFVTADVVGQPSHGGGTVTAHEAEALRTLGDLVVWDRGALYHAGQEPWQYDDRASEEYVRQWYSGFRPALAHFYAGTFTKTVKCLRHRDCKVTYTCAAHSVPESRAEHERMGIPYAYPHLTEPDLWQRYVGGYLLADRLIVPSTHSRDVVISQGADPARVVVIPHGVSPPDRPVKPLPARFTVGYLGACSAPDKGLVYLLQAWKKLAYPDAVLRVAGRDSTSPYVQHLVEQHGGGNVELVGWVASPWDFMDSLSLYVQPSVSEGFGIEVLEALARGIPVTCSEGAGAVDCLRDEAGEEDLVHAESFPARDADALAESIDWHRRHPRLAMHAEALTARASLYHWDRVRARYVDLWRSLLT